MAILGLYATFFTVIFAAYPVTSVKQDECPKKQEIMCWKIQTSKGFTYHAPEMKRRTDDCEHGWYYPNGTFIEDSTGNGTRPKSLPMTNCVNLQWQINCHTVPVIDCVVNYSVSDQGKYTINDSLAINNTFPDDNRDSKQKEELKGLWVILIIVFLGFGLCWICVRKKKYCLRRFSLCWHNSVV